MLDNLDNIVMLCGATPENRVFYINCHAEELMARRRFDLNFGLRGADVGNVAAKSIHQSPDQPPP